MAKYLLIAAIVISLATAGIGFVNHGTLVDTKTQLEQTKTTLGARTADLDKTSKSLKETQTTLEATKTEVKDTAQKLTDTTKSLEDAKTQLDTATKDGADKDAKIAKLEEQINSVNPGGEPGADPAKALKDKLDQMTQRAAEQDAQISSLSEKATADKTLITTLQADKKAREDRIMKKGLEGRVLAVNPAWNFVVLGIGDKQGVVSNAEMLLKRGDQFLGKVRITSVEPSTSIADIIVNTLPAGVSVQPGDSVIFQGND
jgi:cell shape-determining protein MreC